MRTSLLPALGLLTLLTPFLTKAAAPTHTLYAAVAMTKAQKNSATPADSGLYIRKADGSWENFGPRVLGVYALAVQPGSHGRVLLVASGDGILRSADAGKTWRLTTGWEVADVRAFAFNPANADEICAATCWGPLRSTDGGATWTLAQAGLNLLYCQTVVADAQQPGRVLLGTEDGIYLSQDGARTWARTDSPPALALHLAQSTVAPGLMLVGTRGRGAWISHDAGRSWTQTDPGSAQGDLYATALDPHDADRMALGGWGVGVRVSADGGQTWADRSAGLPVKNIFVVAFDPDVKGRLWASTFEEGTFFSDDLGATWQNGGLYGAYAFNFIFVPAAQ
jgi:photosystem II stability/assembly factor-like uncharacterized protein